MLGLHQIPTFKFNIVVRLVKPTRRARYYKIPATERDIANVLEKAMTPEVLYDLGNGWRLHRIYGEEFQFPNHQTVAFYVNDEVLYGTHESEGE